MIHILLYHIIDYECSPVVLMKAIVVIAAHLQLSGLYDDSLFGDSYKDAVGATGAASDHLIKERMIELFIVVTYAVPGWRCRYCGVKFFCCFKHPILGL